MGFEHYASACFVFEAQRFRARFPSPSSGKSLLGWPQSIELLPLLSIGPNRLRSLPEDGDGIQFPRRWVSNEEQDNGNLVSKLWN
jgi:hypothetical protein